MFINLNRKYIDKNYPDDNDLPFELKCNNELMIETYNNNIMLYSSNLNTLKILLNTNNVIYFSDCSSDNFYNPYLYYYLGSKTKIKLKNNKFMYVIETVEYIKSKISFI